MSQLSVYQNKSKFKVIAVSLALLIGFVSLYYTNTLVQKLVDREKKQIELFGQALRYITDSENDQPITFIHKEIINSNTSIPLILVADDGSIINFKNIEIPKNISEEDKQKLLEEELELMKKEYPPIVVEHGKKTDKSKRNIIYYRNSDLIYQLKYYPYAQLTVIFIFGLLTYLAFSYSRKAEQNRVWVGLAKETAHQLGTPISSLMAWVEYLKSDEKLFSDEVLVEIEKDVKKLEMVTNRFSNIGSHPTLKDEDVFVVIQEIISYLKPRISPKIEMKVINYLLPNMLVKMNRHLFEWVIENLCKNAVDSINGTGSIEIKLKIATNYKKIFIDISDTGKGISKYKTNKIFDAGYTTKKRGWGLGLTLAKRIIEEYHKGKIFVKNSEIDKGTKFRIILNHDFPNKTLASYDAINNSNKLTANQKTT
jgi:two-component system, sporulation sensor kinase E